MMNSHNEAINWTSFRIRFQGQYFPDNARHERERERERVSIATIGR